MILGDVIENMCLSNYVDITLVDDSNDNTLSFKHSLMDIEDEFYTNYEVKFTTLMNNSITFYIEKMLDK